jgi:hypothetical protein
MAISLGFLQFFLMIFHVLKKWTHLLFFCSRFREMDANGDGEMDSQDPLHGLTLDLRPIGCQCLPGNIPGNHPISQFPKAN